MLPLLLLLLPLISAHPLDSCPGYRATNVQTTDVGLTANLTLAGSPCNVYGQDLQHLLLQVTYETDHRLHVKIQDVHNQVYQVPPSVFPRPANPPTSSADTSALLFTYTAAPFSFAVVRRSTADVLFDTSPAPLVFQSQYLRLRTALPPDPNLYGLGEHADSFRLNASSSSGRYVRTLWNRDSFAVPEGTNLYGSHAVYLEQRPDAAHAVFLLNSNGMDVVLDRDAHDARYLEYNTLGGVADLYFFAGPDPQAVARQYAAVAGTPAMPPYWSLGFHNCRWGYRDAFELAEVVRNYSAAAIPLEALWTDIDYMDRRRVFSLDPLRFPRRQMRALVDRLHADRQRYVVMVDPAVAYADYPPLRRGIERGAFLRDPRTGGDWRGVVWPGLVAFPDWFADGTEEYWVDEFRRFFSHEDGVDIDGLWIDMNEPSVFDCGFLCNDPVRGARGFPPPAPPVRSPPREIPGWPCVFQPQGCDNHTDPDTATESTLTDDPSSSDPVFSPPTPNPSTFDAAAAAVVPGTQKGLPGRDLLYPRYAIHNKAAYADAWNADRGGLSNRTVNTDVIHRNGYAMYDTHNLYGAQMSTASHAAMLARRPGLRPFIITRSTFAGAGRRVGHWLGDNLSTWHHYRASIRGMLAFTAVYQFGMVGADVCGFSDAEGPATAELCARWAALGAFYPFFRNHNTQGAAPHEFYRWDSVAAAARDAIRTRYRLLDYLYTAMRRASADGTPAVAPVFYHYPRDPAAWPLELQFFFGPALMVCPVTEEGATSVDVYLPDDAYYDWHTYEPVYGRGRTHTFSDVGVGSVPLLVRAGYIVPMRNQSADTTTELREHGFELLIPVDYDRHATGELYLDDGVSIEQKPNTVTHITFTYNRGVLTVNGTFAGNLIPCVTKIVILGEQIVNDTIASRKRANKEEKLSRSVQVNISLNEASKITI